MTGVEEVLAVLRGYGPPAPSLLPWIAQYAADDALLLVARVAASQAALAPLLRWPAVTDACAEALALRAQSSNSEALVLEFSEVLPPIAAYLDRAWVTRLAEIGARADALAYASLIQPGDLTGEPTLQSLDPLWQEVLLAEQERPVPPLANLELLARLIRVPPEPLGDFLGSEVVYLLPYRSSEDWASAAMAEVQRYATGDPWYAAALFARAAVHLSDGQRFEIVRTNSRGAPAPWREVYDRISRDASSQEMPTPADSPISARSEIQASHPVLPRLRRFTDNTGCADLAEACASILREMSETYGSSLPERWEPAEPELEPEESEQPIVRSGQEQPAPPREQVRLSVSGNEIGHGERLQLPGASTRYRLLKFTCPDCDQPPEYRIFYDEEDLPVCREHGQMGKMELLP